MNYRFSSIVYSIKTLYAPMKYPLVLILAIASSQTYAAPSNMGSITVTSRNLANGTASGTYIAAGSKATGSFTLTRNDTQGYSSVSMNPTLNNTGTNGIEISNLSDTNVSNDRFTYTFTITPNDNTAIHTIKIGQASYTTTGNSEVARQTIKHTPFVNDSFELSPNAMIQSNEDVPYFYNAMGDYFMGSKVNATQLNSQINISNPQLRTDSSGGGNSGLYYYNITSLTGVTGNQNPYTPILNTNKQVSLNSNNGILPPTPTFENIIKSINNGSTYPALANNSVIPNNGTYVSYGIENSQSNYVIAVKNAQSVTLTYEGIMNGNIGISRPVVGETFIEWISFGVESQSVYNFSGTVFNDNGGINDTNANADTIGSIYNNARFFNGVFEPAPASPAEKGINESTVQLADDCTKTTPTVYATKVIPDSDVGRYQFNILPSVLSGRNSVCLIETRTNSNDVSYPIRTTTNRITVNLVTNTYRYAGNNFGRVIEANKALVLEKEQALNNCSISTLPPSSQNNLVYSKDNLVNVNSGQCIAYKIIATNRANLPVSNFVMNDILQKAGVNNATVSSVLAVPSYNSDDYATDSVKVGKNDVPVKTKILSIAEKGQRIFYFNTKYGTTNSNP